MSERQERKSEREGERSIPWSIFNPKQRQNHASTRGETVVSMRDGWIGTVSVQWWGIGIQEDYYVFTDIDGFFSMHIMMRDEARQSQYTVSAVLC